MGTRKRPSATETDHQHIVTHDRDPAAEARSYIERSISICVDKSPRTNCDTVAEILASIGCPPRAQLDFHYRMQKVARDYWLTHNDTTHLLLHIKLADYCAAALILFEKRIRTGLTEDQAATLYSNELLTCLCNGKLVPPTEI